MGICSISVAGEGIGPWFAEQSGARLTGVDSSPEAISQAKRRAELFPRANASFVVAVAANTSLEDRSADAIVCIDSLQLVPDREQVVREMARLLRLGSRAVITTWERDEEGPAGRTPIRDAGRLVESNGLRLILREEHPDWMERQTEMFERAIAEDGHDAEPAVRRSLRKGERSYLSWRRRAVFSWSRRWETRDRGRRRRLGH